MLQPVILAAGKGMRMGSELPKTLYPVGGKPMLERILSAFEEVGLPKPIIVVGFGKEHIMSRYKGFTYAVQTELTGTASAVKTALAYVPEGTEGVLVMYGDQPFVRRESLEALKVLWEKERPTFIQSIVTVPDFKDWRSVFLHFGRVVRDAKGKVSGVIEYKNADEAQRASGEVNPGMCTIELGWLKGALPRVGPNPVNGEFYLTDLVAFAHADGKQIETIELEPKEAIGVNSTQDATHAELFSDSTPVV